MVETTYNSGQVDVYVVPHDLSGGGVISGSCKDLISAMNTSTCNIGGSDETDYDGEYAVALNALVTSLTQDEQKLSWFHFVNLKMVMIIHVVF